MNYYVYTLAYPNGTVFYVGKGCGNRVAHHEQEALRGHTCPKCELIRSIWQQGGTVQRAIVFETDDEQAALAHEMALINSFGPDQLINQRGGYLFRSKPARCIRVKPTTDEVFTSLLNQLFDRHRRADGKEYTNHEIAKATAGKLSPTYLAKLRSGEIPNPGRYRLMLLCKFFHVPAWFCGGQLVLYLLSCYPCTHLKYRQLLEAGLAVLCHARSTYVAPLHNVFIKHIHARTWCYAVFVPRNHRRASPAR